MPRRLRHVAPGAKTLSAVLTLSVFCLSGFVRGTVPFGSESRSLNDLGNQFVPMHAHLAGLLRGTAEGDLFFNWNSGMGVPFLADFYLYLASPLALVAALFPAERIDLAIFIVTAGRMALASVAMTVYLNAIAPRGPRLLLGLFGAAYGLCAWAVDDAAYVPQWLDGLIFLPLLCLVGEWTVRRRRWVPGVLIFAAAWYLNFYSAYMATIGAVAIVLARVLSMEMSWRARLEFGIRYTAAATCGVALVMPLFVPTFLAVSNAPKTDGFAFDVSPWSCSPGCCPRRRTWATARHLCRHARAAGRGRLPVRPHRAPADPRRLDVAAAAARPVVRAPRAVRVERLRPARRKPVPRSVHPVRGAGHRGLDRRDRRTARTPGRSFSPRASRRC
ncbi:YfhO family protein [Actinomadura madurae]|nr:YfhO family protein [Actinomadura madurae]MCP9966943.1 YfhO family protein [Actinomadura madurae]